jgi:hypothetical protein
MEKLTPIQKLDKVLFFLKYEYKYVYKPPIDLFYLKCGSNCDLKELDLILDKLIHDNFIRVEEEKKDYFKYKITFDGWVFIGYENKIEIDARTDRRLIRADNKIFYATLSAAFVGIAVLVWYIFAWYYPNHYYYIHPSQLRP